MDAHVIIEPLSRIWWMGIIGSVISIILLLLVLKNTSAVVRNKFSKILSISFIIVFLVTTATAIISGSWNIQDNLPLHLCRISFIISIIVLWTKKQWMYEWTLYLAIPSGLHSMLTPELTMGLSNWYLFDYYFVHAGLIFVPLYLTYIMGFRTRIDAWKKTFLRVQIAVVLVLPFNFIINSNYMYLKARPIVDNPFLIGEWPIYIIFLELIMLVHILIIHKITPKKILIKN